MFRETWKRNLTMLWISQILVMAGYDALNPFIPLFMKESLHVTETAALAKYAALYNAASYIGYGISNPLWGWLGDRYGMKPMLLRGTFLTSIFWVLMLYSKSPDMLVFFRFLTAFLAGTTAASQMMVARTTPIERQGFAQGTLSTAIWGGSMLGNMIGGLVIHYSGYKSAFWMCGIMYFMAGIAIFPTRDSGTASMKATVSDAAPKVSWWKRMELPRGVWCVLGLFFLMGIIRRMELPFISLRVEEITGIKMAAYWTGIISASVGLGAILSGVIFGHLVDKYPAKKLIIPVMAAFALFMIFQGLGMRLSVFGVSRTLSYFIAGCLQPMLQKLLSQNAPTERRGISFGLSSSATSVGGVIASSMGAVLMTRFGVQGVFIGAGLIALLLTPVYYKGVKMASRKNG